jgi:hypothetical protein
VVGVKAYVLNERAANWLKAQVDKGLTQGGLPEVPQQFADGPLGRVYVLNTHAETVPPHGIMRVTGYTLASDGKVIANVTKPATSIGKFLVNGPAEIPNGQVGIGLNTNPVLVAYETGFMFSASDNYGVDGWKLNRIPDGEPLLSVTVLADVKPSEYLCLANLQQLERILIQAPSGGIPGRVGLIRGGATCDVISVNTATDELTTTNVQAKIYNWSTSVACANGDRYGVAIVIDGQWEVVAEDCNDEGSTLPSAAFASAVSSVTDAIDLTNDPVTTTSVVPDAGYTLGAVAIP